MLRKEGKLTVEHLRLRFLNDFDFFFVYFDAFHYVFSLKIVLFRLEESSFGLINFKKRGRFNLRLYLRYFLEEIVLDFRLIFYLKSHLIILFDQ